MTLTSLAHIGYMKALEQGEERKDFMKKMRKMIAVVLAVTVAMTMGIATSFAATVTVTPPEGTDSDAVNTYEIYKVFDATVNADDPEKVSYTLPSGVTAPLTGFKVVNGKVQLERTTGDLTELTPAEIEAVKAYITANGISALDSKDVKGEAPAEFGNLDPGYYYISTTTGTLVVIKTNNEAISVDDKNTVPELTKKITAASGSLDQAGKNAIAQVGTKVKFESKITVGKGMKNYVFHDTMDSGLKLDVSSIRVTYSAKPEGYVEATPEADSANGTIAIAFNNGLAEGTEITITYEATVTNEALTTDPEKNTAYLNYGNGPTTAKTPEEQTNTYSAKISVLKVDGMNTDDKTDDEGLAGAKFKLYRMNGTTKEYYHLNAASGSNPATITWGAATAADEHEADADGNVPAFVGLQDGEYYLEESFTPDGYNTAADTKVVIAGNDYTANNLEKEATVINNAGGVLPSTGGIGTTIFYILGALLVIGCGVILIARRRMSANN